MDLVIGLSAIAVALFAVFMFIKATNKVEKQNEVNSTSKPNPGKSDPLTLQLSTEGNRVKIPEIGKSLKNEDITKARSNLRTLTLKQELLGMIMKRLFEAEDEGEITREERINLAEDYEKELKDVRDELKESELIVSLNELETIREDIIKKFEATLNTTQARIDQIMGELNLEPPRKTIEKPSSSPKLKDDKQESKRKSRPVSKQKQEDEAEQIEDTKEQEDNDTEDMPDEKNLEEESQDERRSNDVEDRLNKLKQDILRELEELDRLELEV
jgi:hypothetical protein